MKWKNLGSNSILQGKGFYISYNPSTGANHMGGLLTNLGNALGADLKDGEETALCIEKKSGKEWAILEGDFRKEYEKAFPSLMRCKKVYEKNKDKRSNWSTV